MPIYTLNKWPMVQPLQSLLTLKGLSVPQHHAITETELITVDLLGFEMNRLIYHRSDYLHSSLGTLNTHV